MPPAVGLMLLGTPTEVACLGVVTLGLRPQAYITALAGLLSSRLPFSAT